MLSLHNRENSTYELEKREEKSLKKNQKLKQKQFEETTTTNNDNDNDNSNNNKRVPISRGKRGAGILFPVKEIHFIRINRRFYPQLYSQPLLILTRILLSIHL